MTHRDEARNDAGDVAARPAAASAETRETDAALATAARRQRVRERRGREEGELGTMRMVGQIGILGWIIVTPALLGLLLGRWLDGQAGTKIFFAAPLLMLGVAAGGWSAWRWMHRQ